MKLVEEFYPPTERARSGSLIWATCTADEGQKAEPGKRTEEYKTVTVKLPLVMAEDIRDRIDKKSPPQKKHARAAERDKKRLARLTGAAVEQGGLLTIAELSVMLNKSTI